MKTVLTKEDWLLVAKKYGRNGVGATELAKGMGVSKQRIFQVVQVLRKNGVDIPLMYGAKGYCKGYITFIKDKLK